LNEDRVAPAGGFPTHPHRDMEILTFVLEGALEHKDNMGNGSTIRPGDTQKMSAGTGVLHSEFNPSKSEPVHFLQIWIMPNERGIKPNYEERKNPEAERRGRLKLLASGDAREGAIRLYQDVDVCGSILDAGAQIEHPMRPGRGAYVHVTKGKLSVNGKDLSEGDGAAIEGETKLTFAAKRAAEFLLFDLA
jgi:hypothetical protein